jgi:hypothetical protein
MIRPAMPEDYDVLARAWYEREGFRCEGGNRTAIRLADESLSLEPRLTISFSASFWYA